MKYAKRLLPLLVFILLTSILSAQVQPYGLYFQHYSTRNGLPNNTITCCAQDSLGFIWLGTTDGIYKFDGYNFVSLNDSPHGQILTGGVVYDMEFDLDNDLWFVTSKGVGSFNLQTKDFFSLEKGEEGTFYNVGIDGEGFIWLFSRLGITRYNKNTGESASFDREHYFSPLCSVTDSNGRIWFAATDGRLYCYNSYSDGFFASPVLSEAEVDDGITISSIGIYDEEHLVIASSDNDIVLFNPVSGQYNTLINKNLIPSSTRITSLSKRSASELWIGTDAGIFTYNTGSRNFFHLTSNATDQYSLSGDNISCIFRDKDANMWVGTRFKGLNLMTVFRRESQRFFANSSPNSLEGTAVSAITGDTDGNIWIGTEDGGLNSFNINTKKNRKYVDSGIFPKNLSIRSLLVDGNLLWIATATGGLYAMNIQSETIAKHYSRNNSTLNTSNITSLLKNESGTLYLGTQRGVYYLSDDQFQFIDEIGDVPISSLSKDNGEMLWVGTYGEGLWHYDPRSEIAMQFHSDGVNNYFPSDYITNVFKDSRGCLWVGTDGYGLYYSLNPNQLNPQFYSINKPEGLPSNIVSGITESRDGRIWVSTDSGFVEIDPISRYINTVYQKNDEIIGDHYMMGAVYIDDLIGDIYMGTSDGMISFTPSLMDNSFQGIPLYITSVTTNVNSVFKTSDFTLPPEVDFLYFSVAAPHYHSQKSIQYQYTLQSRDRVLTSYSFDNTALYTDLRPGQYTFTAKIIGGDPDISAVSSTFRIKNPFRSSVLAFILYGLLLAGAVFLLYLYNKKRKIQKELHTVELLEASKQQEIYSAKINFFTNIAHEIRTPLTLIKLPLDKILAQKTYSEEQRENLETMDSNVNKLLDLVNHLLDMRKMEKDQMELSFMKEEINGIVENVLSRFNKTAEERGTSLNLHLPEEKIYALCARNAVEIIISNLISNAVKYGTDSIDIYLSATEDDALIRVNSRGARISEKDADKIFEQFYQIEQNKKNEPSNGTGLGLPFSRMLAELHNGRLFLDTDVTDCNSFVFQMPLSQPEVAMGEDAVEELPEDEEIKDQMSDSARKTILIVEDETEMRNYLAKDLADEYNTLTACDGEDAMEKLSSERIDLVLSDVMMPKMDGCQLCNAIKANLDFSHIPVILFTAVAGIDTHIETLESGADCYIEKPFSMALLRASIRNLFTNRILTYKQYTSSPLSYFNGASINKTEQEFIDKLHNYIMENISDSEMNIDNLCKFLGTSKSTLYRKIKSNMGINTNEYIRLCRLKKAAELLASTAYRVNEVAFLTGFSSLSYFTSSFKKQFNISPSDFVKQQKEKASDN